MILHTNHIITIKLIIPVLEERRPRAPLATGMLTITDEVLCPQCGSGRSKVVSEFGSTACKRLLVCTTCGEPFDHFKEM